MAKSRVNDGLPRERGVWRSLQEWKVGYLLVQSDRRETTAALEGTQLSSCNMYDTLLGGKVSNNTNTRPFEHSLFRPISFFIVIKRA